MNVVATIISNDWQPPAYCSIRFIVFQNRIYTPLGFCNVWTILRLVCQVYFYIRWFLYCPVQLKHAVPSCTCWLTDAVARICRAVMGA